MGRRAERASWRKLRCGQGAGAVRDGHRGHLANPSQRKSWQRSEGRGRRPENAREALVSSTQDQSFRVLRGMLRRLGRGHAEEQAAGTAQSNDFCSETVGGSQGPVQKQHRAPTFCQSAWHDAIWHWSRVQMLGCRLSKGQVCVCQNPSITFPLEPQFSHQLKGNTVSPHTHFPGLSRDQENVL